MRGEGVRRVIGGCGGIGSESLLRDIYMYCACAQNINYGFLILLCAGGRLAQLPSVEVGSVTKVLVV